MFKKTLLLSIMCSLFSMSAHNMLSAQNNVQGQVNSNAMVAGNNGGGGGVLTPRQGPNIPVFPEEETIKPMLPGEYVERDVLVYFPFNLNEVQDLDGQSKMRKGMTLEGKLLFPKSWSISIHTKYQGIQFVKDLDVSQIKSIEIMEWQGDWIEQTNNQYKFLPSQYRITTDKDVEFILNKNIDAFNKIRFVSKYGDTTIYTYYLDYWNGQVWAASGLTMMTTTVQSAIPNVVQKIEFLTDSEAKRMMPAQTVDKDR